MKSALESLGFTVRASESAGPHERRIQVYLDGYLVAWFHGIVRVKDGVRSVGTDTQFEDLAALTAPQFNAIMQWFCDQARDIYMTR